MKPSNQQHLQQSESIRRNHSLTLMQNDIQYQIWNNLIKQTSDSLIEKQLRVMADSSQLIDYFTQQLANPKISDQNATQDQTQAILSGYFNIPHQKQANMSRSSMFKMSLSNDDMFNRNLKNQRNQFQSPNSKTLFRKSPLAHHKSYNFIYSRQLRDVEDNCRPKTYKAMKTLIDDLGKMKQYFTDSESNEKRLMRNIAILEKDQEKHIILNKIHDETQKKLLEQTKQIQKLKVKVKKLNVDHETKSNASWTSSHQQVNVNHLLNYLNRKEANINEKFQKIVDIENSTMKMIYQQFEGEIQSSVCSKCCDFIKKAKNTLSKLRQFLKQQSEQMQKIYNDYKSLLVEDIKRISNRYTTCLSPMSKKTNFYGTGNINY